MDDPGPNYLDRKLFIIIADDPHAAGLAAEAVDGAGATVAATVGFAGSLDRLVAQTNLHGILIEARGVDEQQLHDALPAIDAVARDRRIGLVASMATDQIDTVWSCLADGKGALLCDPRVLERVAAIAPMTLDTRFHDISREEDARLQLLNAEVARFAETIARLSQGGEGLVGVAAGVRETSLRFGVEADVSATAVVDAGTVRNLIRARRLRANHFAADLFADPAWDMLLDLFAAELEHRRVSVSSLCIAAAVPGTTALRWIGTMVDAGLFERHADKLDRRRAYVGLSDKARDALLRYFEGVRRAGLNPA